MRREPKAAPGIDLAGRLQAILATKNLTLYEVSRISESLYGRSSHYFIPHNLYYELRMGAFRPSIYQLSFLSRVSNYRLNDWLSAFGFNVEDILRLQILLPSNRTVLLNSSLDDPHAWIPWLGNRFLNRPIPSVAPLAELLEFTHHRRLDSVSRLEADHFLYCKIGREDAVAFPDLLPESIVRISPPRGNDFIFRRNGTISNRLFTRLPVPNTGSVRIRRIGG